MPKQVKEIVIVGGGTAGWLSALYLSRSLSLKRGSQPGVTITLIESSAHPTVGVGEATVPHIKGTFAHLNLDEEALMVACNATFKLGIQFINWSGIITPDHFWSPFDPIPTENELERLIFAHIQRCQRAGYTLPFDYSGFRSVMLCEAGKAPRSGVEPPYVGKIRYAYHLDAGLLAEYLKREAIKDGVVHLIGTVQDAVLNEEGFITHLITDNGALDGDFFLDCSGFRGVLINQALGEPFISYADELLCDRAVALSLPYDESRRDKNIPPYTTATALSAGWVWNTPLFTRHGIGYVYSSTFLSSADAENELRAHLAAVGKPSEEQTARHIKMRVGRTRQAWRKNCVSIGLASGFIEPLESTGIFLIEVALKQLVAFFPDQTFNPILINAYNEIMRRYYEEIRDFIVMHYCTTQREDTPFWQHYKHDPILPDTLQRKLALWQALELKKGQLAATLHLFDGWAFGKYLHLCILTGMNYFPKRNLSAQMGSVTLPSPKPAVPLKAKLPGHRKYLEQLHRGDFAAYRQLFLG